MSNYKILIPLAAAAMMLCACKTNKQPETTVTWTNLGNDSTTYVQRFVVKGDLDFDRLAFNMFKRQMQPLNEADTLIELLPGYFVIKSDRFSEPADSIVIDILVNATLSNRSYAPDGVHLVEHDGSTRPVTYVRNLLTEPHQWRAPGGRDVMPYGDEIYDRNAELTGVKDGTESLISVGIYDIVPSYKSVTLTDGVSTLPLTQVVNIVPTDKPEAYTITVANDSLIINAADQRTADMALFSFTRQVLDNAEIQILNVKIEDYPDFPYRGFMLDICRNYQQPEDIKRFIDYMAEMRMNIMHLHMLDDEAWRLEIAGLPELTEYAGRRGYSTDEADFLFQMYSGDGNPNTTEGVSNGCMTREQYKDLLKYADSRGVYVIPEFETPGHARAARRAMEYRYRKTGDDTYRLIHDGDTSEYTSAQEYHDNVMNPAVAGTYRFVDKVVTDLAAMHAEAGVPLLSIHIGGDEVARGAWSGSELANALIEEKGLDGQTGLHGYFVDNMSDMFVEKGLKLSGWQEIAIGHTPEYNTKMGPLTYSVNCWTQSSDNPEKSVTARALRAGFPVVISNVNHFYLDMCYNRHPEEPGLKWGGIVDEFISLNGYPKDLCPVDPDKEPGSIIGLSGHLFAETIRSPQMVELYLFPKMLGLAERAWNAEPTYSDASFNAVIEKNQLPRWERQGRNFHLRQAGIKRVGDEILMNSPYADAEIRYTTDGTEPNAQSALYTSPIPADGITQVRARLYSHGKESVTTYLYL